MSDSQKTNKAEAGLLPRLRFPEFRKAGEWNFQPLRELAKHSKRKNVDGEITRVLTNSAEFGVIDQRDFFDKDIANQGNLEGYYIVEEGAYVYNPRISVMAPVGPVSKNMVGLGVMSPLYTVFQFNNSDDDFFAHYFKSTHWHQYMRQVSSTGARHDRMSIANDDFMGLPLPVSVSEEQQKIADCLSSLDELITAEAQKLDALKSHKNGLMQQLFPREGETVPRLRFPEFQGVGDWELKKLVDLAAFSSGGTPSKNDPAYWYGDIPWVSASSMHDVRLYDSDLKVTPAAIGNGTRLAPRNSLLVLVRGSMLFKRVPICIAMADMAFNQDVKALTIKGNANVHFILYQLMAFSPNIPINETGIGAGKIETEILENLAMSLPSLLEQQKIADCLATLDDQITAQVKRIDTLKTHKKGLMQQLFPVPEDVPA